MDDLVVLNELSHEGDHCRFRDQRREVGTLDVGRGANDDVSHLLPRAVEEFVVVGEHRSIFEAEMNELIEWSDEAKIVTPPFRLNPVADEFPSGINRFSNVGDRFLDESPER